MSLRAAYVFFGIAYAILSQGEPLRTRSFVHGMTATIVRDNYRR